MGLQEPKSLCNNGGDKITSIEVKKCCSHCKTTKTPLWRGGPAGPKTLCNACGIKYRKQRRAVLGSDKKERTAAAAAAAGYAATSESYGSENEELGKDVKVRLKMEFERSVTVKKQRCERRRRLFGGEEEQAAFSLMAMSSSSGSVSVFA